MRIKYYLRGLGTGILVTTIIITISNSIRNNEIKIQQLTGQTPTGMYQTQASSSDAALRETFGSTESAQSAASGGSQGTETQEQPDNTQTQPSTEALTQQQPTGAQESTAAQTQQATAPVQIPVSTRQEPPVTSEITVSFNSVNSSEAASRLLQDAGLVEDWREFNTFLIDNGYDRRISNGTFTFAGNETFEEIAAIITR